MDNLIQVVFQLDFLFSYFLDIHHASLTKEKSS
jgi:hypothetical protein